MQLNAMLRSQVRDRSRRHRRGSDECPTLHSALFCSSFSAAHRGTAPLCSLRPRPRTPLGQRAQQVHLTHISRPRPAPRVSSLVLSTRPRLGERDARHIPLRGAAAPATGRRAIDAAQTHVDAPAGSQSVMQMISSPAHRAPIQSHRAAWRRRRRRRRRRVHGAGGGDGCRRLLTRTGRDAMRCDEMLSFPRRFRPYTGAGAVARSRIHTARADARAVARNAARGTVFDAAPEPEPG